MRMILLLAGAASLALGPPALAQGNSGGGDGGGKGREDKSGPAQGGGDRGKGSQGAGAQRGGSDRGGPQQKAEPRGEAGPRAAQRNDKGPERVVQKVRPESRAVNGAGLDKGPDKGPMLKVDRRVDDRGPPASTAQSPRRKAIAGRDEWRDDSRLLVERTWDGNRYRYDDRAYLVPTASWCPPGLARKNNGCLPPGQARKLDGYDGWSNWYPVRYREDGYDWRYNDGYMYRTDSGGLISALIPLIGGALFGGQVWPQQYTGYEAPAYYDRFYGYDDGYDYRVAQNAIFAVDPRSGQIDGIAGLLTGDRWSVGKRMPTGYDVYNVPPSYRDRYSDRDDAMYRYSDGYVYEVDPTTQLVRAVMELLV